MRAAAFLMVVLAACSVSGGAAIPPPTVEGWERAPSIVAGAERTCVVLRDGGVACWGNGWTGRLGDGRTTDSPTPVRVEGSRSVVRLSGAAHTCALTSEGEVFCWGSFLPTGLVGEASHADFPLPTLQPFGPAVDIDSGSNHICALDRDGRMRCRSPADHGPSSLGIEAPRRFVRDGRTVCAIDAAGALACSTQSASTGDDDTYEPAPPSGISAIDLATSPFGPRVLALRSDGRVVGRDRLGDGEWTDVEMPAPVAALGGSMHGAHACVVLADGGVACWGTNDRGQLGDGTFLDRRTEPARVRDLEDAVAVAAGWNHSCAIRRGGRIACWGANDRGQLGDGSIEASPVPVEVLGVDLSASPELTLEPPPAGLCLERDTDGDGLGDRLEAGPPHACPLARDSGDDGDGVDRARDDDSDGDGFPDAVEHVGHACAPAARDCDDDGVPEHVDRDSDDDGLWDADEESLEAACAADRDGDGCDDLSEAVLGGCSAESGVALLGRGRTHGDTRPAEIELVVGDGPSAPFDVTLHVEDLVVLREPVLLTFEPVITAVASESGAVASGARFLGAVSGETLRFEVRAGRVPPYFDGDTASARASLVLRDVTGTERARGAVLLVLLPDGTCPGP